MRILLTNDDGIHAEGLASLERVARTLSDDVWVVAPEQDQSGYAHSLSISEPLRLRKIGEKHFAVRGTPTDCVIMGVKKILPGAPDLILSGINSGANIADDVTYSGTVAGAMEGTLLGIPSIALSQAHGLGGQGAELRWTCAEAHGPAIIRKLLAHGFAKGMLFNVNFPDCEPDEITGTSVTVQGRRDQAALMEIVERQDFRGNPYYWIAFLRHKPTPLDGTDLWAMAEKRISITPLKLDLTDFAALERLSEVFDGPL